ncbi:MAG: response regulator transcription factor [Bacteriovoracaceae bacterium]|jgi:DNA-binding response OmpR family regulator|nr:response regulator transcription factor [Bacteriovoracaceae bacterium]
MDKKLSILLVEDELSLSTTLSEYLTLRGYQVKSAQSCEQAKEIFANNDFNVVLMDIGLPDGSGIDLAKEFRLKRKDFVLLFLSALNDPEIKFEGLSIGAEDYITKPFDLRELMLRLSRILKATNKFEQAGELVTFGNIKIWFKKFEIQDAKGILHSMSQKECMILNMLFDRKNEVVSRQTLIENIWGENAFPSNRTVDNYIVKLRKWIEDDNNPGVKISSIRGIGYKLEI